jgi:hypothetical protein
MDENRWFERLAAVTDVEATSPQRAPARLKARLYSSIVSELAAAGPLRSLAETKAEGRTLCIFEEVVATLPLGDDLKCRNPCRVCHARVLGERMEHAPIFWPGCPYSKFHNG